MTSFQVSHVFLVSRYAVEYGWLAVCLCKCVYHDMYVCMYLGGLAFLPICLPTLHRKVG